MYPTPRSSGMSPEDEQVLRDLAGRYGSGNLAHTLRGMNRTHISLRPGAQRTVSASARHSALSTLTFGSENSAPSLTSSGPWSGSDASYCGSDAVSIAGSFFTQSPGAWGEAPDPTFIMSPTTPSLSGSEWQDQLSSPPCEKKANINFSNTSRKAIECPMCAVYDVYVGFGRKSDFKKHLQNFHNTDCIWVCPQSNCRMIFDVEKAYTSHFKTDHGDSCPPSEQVKVELCPQVVFACGFIGCKQVFEASGDSDATSVVEKYFDHIAGHFDKRCASSEWTYYHQVQNLLRQHSLKDEWKHTLWDKTARNQLRWQPRSSGDFKKLLECRHLPDVPKILHAAWTLGQTSFSSPEHPAPEFPGEATRPVRGLCALSAKGHSELHVTHHAATGPQTILSLRRNLFPVKLATVSHPPPRSIPEEPDSLEYAHPGTPLVLPERDDWSTNVVLGPPEDEQLFDPMMYPGTGLANPISPWCASQSMGDLSPPTPESDGSESCGPLLQVPQPSKRHLSWGRSLENLRLKRRSGPLEEKGALPAWI